MRKTLLIICMFSFVFFLYGCSSNKKSAITIGSIKITAEEFQSAFNKSAYAEFPTKENRQKFLDMFLSRKLILEEAQRKNYDKDSVFLENVQSFWEQSLLKLVLNKKMKELTAGINVSDQDAMDYYQAHKQEFPNKDIAEAYEQIKLQVFTMKQSQAIEEWVSYLKKKANIKIDYKLLGLK